jgi:ABC-type phosphate/phosphonate transport system substrate-binding protein
MKLSRRRAIGIGLALTIGGARGAVRLMAEPAAPAGAVQIGMVHSLFRDVPAPLVQVLMRPFAALMEAQTGMAGRLVVGDDAVSLGQQLADNKVQLAVFHGFEFAWARQQHADLRPLLIAVNQVHHLRALVLVRGDCKAAGLADLKGKCLALPRGTREHCHLFLERRCQQCGRKPADLFTRTATPPNAEDALDDLVDNDVQAAVVDQLAFDCFKRRKPGRAAALRVLLRSEVFPAAVIAYVPGTLTADSLDHFRDGMMSANKNATGRQLLTLWKLTAFEPVPEDYDATLAGIVKAYPPPGKGAKP